LKGKDEEAINEYEEELRLYEEELQKARELACAEEFVKIKVETVQEKAQEVGYMGGAGPFILGPVPFLSLTLSTSTDPLSSRTQGLVLQLKLLQERLATLLETPSPPTQGPPPTEAEPWTSRAAFVNWAASAKVDSLPAVPRESGSGTASEDVVITQLQENMEKTGKQEDATVSAQRAYRAVMKGALTLCALQRAYWTPSEGSLCFTDVLERLRRGREERRESSFAGHVVIYQFCVQSAASSTNCYSAVAHLGRNALQSRSLRRTSRSTRPLRSFALNHILAVAAGMADPRRSVQYEAVTPLVSSRTLQSAAAAAAGSQTVGSSRLPLRRGSISSSESLGARVQVQN
jgi:hypothetical protein